MSSATGVRRIVAVAVLSVVLFVGATMAVAAISVRSEASGEIGSATGGEQAASSVCDTVAPDDDGIAVGETQRIGPFEVTVTETEWVPLLQDFFDGGFLQVDYELTNVSDEPVVHRGYYNFTLHDLEPGGTMASPLDDEALMSDVELGPGEGLTGHVSFPVGYIDGEYRIGFQVDGFFDEGDTGYWAVEVEAGRNPNPTDRVVPVPSYTPGVESVSDYDIDIDVDSEGEAHFTETIVYDFSNQMRHGIYRDLIVRQQCSSRFDRVYPLEVVSVDSPSGAPDQYVVETQGGMKRIKIGDPDATISGVQTYVVEYQLDGTLNGFDDHDELYWNVVGDQWGISLYDINVTVSVPGGADQAACFAGDTGSRAPCTEASIVDGVAEFHQGQLNPFDGLTIAVGFPKGAVPDPQPILDEKWSFRRAFSLTPFTIITTGVLTVLVIGGVALLRRRVGADLQVVGSPTDIAFAPVGAPGSPAPFFEDDHSPVEFAPPDGIRPGQMSVLMHERARPSDISATIVDLAVRGFLRIEEIRGGTDYKFERLGKDTGELLGYEAQLLNSLFGNRNEVELSDLRTRFSSKMKACVRALYDDVLGRGWFDGRPDQIRTKWRVRGVLLTIVALVALVVAIIFTKLALIVLPLVLLGLLLTFGAGAMPRRTPAGTGMLRRCKGFEQFITDSEAPRACWAEQKNIFSEYLPYAIVLGEADRWASTFESLGEEAVTSGGIWYQGAHPFSPVYLSNSINTFTSTSAATLMTLPPSTSGSSGSSGFSSSSSSFSSGGSSGGGGGGGGGGSW